MLVVFTDERCFAVKEIFDVRYGPVAAGYSKKQELTVFTKKNARSAI